jgi:hypothetical protein
MDPFYLHLALGALILSCVNFIWLLWLTSSSGLEKELTNRRILHLSQRLSILEDNQKDLLP